MKYKSKDLSRSTEFIFTNSKDYTQIKNNYLQVGIINIIWGTITNLLNKESLYVDKLGKYTTFRLSNEDKTVLVIILCRIPQTLSVSPYNALTHCNRQERNIALVTKYKKKILNKMK